MGIFYICCQSNWKFLQMIEVSLSLIELNVTKYRRKIYLLQLCLSTLVHCLPSKSSTPFSAAVAVADADKNLFVSIKQAQTHLDHLKVLDELWGELHLNPPDNG